MGLKTKIEYADSTHNFFYGCTKVSEGCKKCFAEKIYKRFYGNDFSKIIKSKNFDAPLKWKKPRVILVNDMSDFFHEKAQRDWHRDAFCVMSACSWHQFLLLTKRPENIKKGFIKVFPKNVWLGVSVENQKAADERIPELLKIPHFKKWLSVEPMLSDISLKHNNVDWVVCGGETGKGARPMQSNWARSLRDQCFVSKIPFFMKQMSNKEPIPKDLQVREYPPCFSQAS